MKSTVFIYLLVMLLPVTLCWPQESMAQGLPQPSGKSSIGHHRFEWTDSSRSEMLATVPAMRRIVADVWYPATRANGETVPYIDTAQINRAFGDKGLKSFVGPEGAALIRSGKFHTHAHEDASFDKQVQHAPVIVFSHGMGMITQLYTAQIEDLASHGYIVVALSHPYDAWIVCFADGTQIPFETKERSIAGNTEVQHITYENKRIEWWAQDIRFALDQLTIIKKANNAKLPFAAHMDLSKIGAVGHSAGGRAAARACQLDTRIKSCADQDGVAMMQPFYLDADSVGMTQPFLLFERVRNVTLTQEDADELKMTLKDLNELVNGLRNAKKAALAATGGSYHVLLRFDSSSHMSFSDLPLLQAKDDSSAMAARRVLQVTCRYTREFFDKTLRNKPAPLYDGDRKTNYIELVQKYTKAGSKRK